MARFFKPQKKILETKHQTLTIMRLDHQGNGVAFDGKKPIFVAGALPNEEVLVQLVEDKRQYSKAKIIKICKASPERIAPFCPYYRQCGGCDLQHLNHQAQITAKQDSLSQLMKKFALAEHGQEPSIVGKDKGYRRRARLSVKVDKSNQLKMGFRQRGSNDIVTIESCPVLSSRLNHLLPPLYILLDSLKGRRIIGHVELVEADIEPVLLVRAMKNLHDQDVQMLIDFARQHKLSVYLKLQDKAVEHLYGEVPFYQLGDIKLNFEPQDFIQVNSSVNQKMVEQAIDWLAIKDKDKVLDLFCGLGNFSLPIAQRASLVTGVEGVDAMVVRAKENASCNHIENVQFFQADLDSEQGKMIVGQENYNKILLDPARAGAMAVMAHVAQSNATHVVYVSCDPATLARDAQILLDSGYKLAKLGMLDMFPHTRHLEAMALFVRD